MQAGAVTLGHVFAFDHQNIIPLFQRPYVWSEERNWLPLWLDIKQAAEEVERDSDQQTYAGQAAHRTYFLGAMVIQHRPKPPASVYLWNVVDGQQRLTTLQVLIAAARSAAINTGSPCLAANFASMIENRKEAIHPDFPDDVYKVWPLPQDRKAFLWAVSASDDRGPSPDSEHRITKAREWFEESIGDWAKESPNQETRLYHLLETLRNRMQLVQITLDVNDDPQVIFEVLNHRGVPLDAADLVKNLLFQQFEIGGKTKLADDLLLNVWGDLDHLKPWREEVTTGRFKRKRIDVLLSYWLTIETAKEVIIEHLFADFKVWYTSTSRSATDVIKDIRHHANCMQEMRALPLTDATGQLLDRMEATQTTTPWPVLLYLHANPDIPFEQRQIASRAIDSYLMRRGICRWTGKDYNRLFLTVLTAAKSATPTIAGTVVEQMLVSQTADSRRFPTDNEFGDALLAPNLYYVVIRARLKSLLVGIDNHLFNSKVDSTHLHSSNDSSLSIEHLLPQSWTKNWPLSAKPSNAAYNEIKLKRDLAVNALGNLTLLTAKLNSVVSNGKWTTKKKKIQKHSLLLLTTTSVLTPPGNYALEPEEWVKEWDEDRIATRSEWLRELALQVWPRSKQTLNLTE